MNEPEADLPHIGPARPGPTSNDEPVIVEREGFSMIWIVPLVALMVGLWLGWQQYINRPLAIDVHFKTGEGIVAGKTEVRFQGISVGTVKDMVVDETGQGVSARVELDHRMRGSLVEGTQFWLVKPEVSFAGVSGLDTLITGNYIGMKPGTGSPSHRFEALESMPPVDDSLPGLHLELDARDLGSLHVGSPVTYRRIAVGMVSQYVLQPDGKGVRIKIFIRPEYAHLVKKNSRFWNNSGLSLEGNLSGIDFHMDSLATLVSGGISFDVPRKAGDPAESGDRFSLLEDYKAARAGLVAYIRFPDAKGIDKVTTQLRYKGFKVGDIKSVTYEKSSDAALVKVAFDPRYEHFLAEGTRFWLVKPELSLSQISGLDTLITGTFIEVSPGDGKYRNRFDALPEPPKIDATRNGLRVRVVARELPALGRGSPVMYRKVPVGEVESFELDADGKSIVMHLFIERAHARLLKTGSRFWNMSGASVKGGINGVNVQIGTFRTLLVGGLGFYTPDDADSRAAGEGQKFTMYESYEQASEQGSDITITFPEGAGLEADAPIKYQGIVVGKVRSLKLSDDLAHVVVNAHLDESGTRLARAKSRFWLVRPEIGLGGATNLDTLIRGLYIAVEPGPGAARTQFEGALEAPAKRGGNSGLDLVLWSRQRGSVEAGSRVYYRQVAVGEVKSVTLADTADAVLYYVNIQPRYQGLVRANTVFWNGSGLKVDLSLFKGASFRTESVESVLKGGIAFATPESPGALVQSGAHFRVSDKIEDEWLDWKPRIALPPENHPVADH